MTSLAGVLAGIDTSVLEKASPGHCAGSDDVPGHHVDVAGDVGQYLSERLIRLI
jgi:hypothetical protein